MCFALRDIAPRIMELGKANDDSTLIVLTSASGDLGWTLGMDVI